MRATPTPTRRAWRPRGISSRLRRISRRSGGRSPPIGRGSLGDSRRWRGCRQGFDEPPKKPARKKAKKKKKPAAAAPAGSFFGAVMRAAVAR